MSNTNNTMQTQTSNALHNAIMEAGGKDRPPMLAQDKDVPVAEGSSETTTERYMENYKNVSQDISDQLNAKAEVVQIILTGIDNDIYSTVDACSNACEMWKAIERLKQGESINVQDLETKLYWEFGKFTSRDEWKRFVTLVKQSQELKTVSYHKLYDILKQHQNEVNEIRAKKLACTANPLALVAQQQPVYHPQNHTTHYTQNSSTRSQQAATRNRGKAIVNSPPPTYDQEPTMVAEDDEMIVNVVGARENVGTPMELEAHYMYMAQIQEVTSDVADNFGPIFDTEPLQKDDDDLANERDLLASLIEKLKCEIDDRKNRNKFLETSNKVLVDKLKGEIEDFKTKNKSLESSNNHFKEANNGLSKTNQLMYKDLKKFRAELDRYNDVKYASKVEINFAKAKGDLISYKMESEKSFNEYTRKINDLNQTISEMKKELFAHQETIFILSQEKVAQIKFYKTSEDKEIDKVIALENKVNVLDNIVYKTGQSVQTMNMLNRNCKTSFAKPEFLKKAQRVNLCLYDIERSKMSHSPFNNANSKETFNKQTTLLEKRMDESIPWDQKSKSSKELFKIKRSVDTIIEGVKCCKQTIAKRTYFGHIDPFIQDTIEGNFCPEIRRINADLEKCHLCLKKEMVADLRYFNSLELEVDSLKSQLETQKTQFLNEIDRLSREYYYDDHMNAILGVYTKLDEATNLQCDYLETLEKCECLEKELSKSKMMSKSFEALHKHAFNLKLDLQQCKEKIKNEKSFKENQSKEFLKEREQYFEIQDLKAQLQDKGIAISVLKKLIEKLKGKSFDTKFEKSSVIRQPNAFKSQRPSILKKPTIFSDSLEKKDCSKSKSVTKNNVSNDFSKPVTTQILPPNKKLILKNTNVLAPGIPALKSNQLADRVMLNNSQGKKQEVEDYRTNVKFSNNKTSVTACNDSLNAKISNVIFVCVTCGKCVLNDNHDKCVLHYLNGVNFRTKMPMDVPISTRKPKRSVNQSVATPLRRTVASKSTNQKPRHTTRKLYEHVRKECSLWYPKFTPPRYKWKPKSQIGNVNPYVSMPLGNASRTATILEPMTPRRSTVSNTTLYSNSFAARRDNPIHRRLWTHFLRSKDETPELLINFLRLVQRGLHAHVRTVRTDKGTEFLNKTLHAYFASEGIHHQTLVARTHEQNGVVERWNRTLVEAARIMLSTAKVPLFF
nr:putative ribonuclease H-like domain-containing protein [Tanacetum cinerariifolium]